MRCPSGSERYLAAVDNAAVDKDFVYSGEVSFAPGRASHHHATRPVRGNAFLRSTHLAQLAIKVSEEGRSRISIQCIHSILLCCKESASIAKNFRELRVHAHAPDYLPIYLTTCLSICLPICPSIYVSIYPSILLSSCLPSYLLI